MVLRFNKEPILLHRFAILSKIGSILLRFPKYCLDLEICDYPSKCLVQNPVGRKRKVKCVD
jgi:hypothetical protein